MTHTEKENLSRLTQLLLAVGAVAHAVLLCTLSEESTIACFLVICIVVAQTIQWVHCKAETFIYETRMLSLFSLFAVRMLRAVQAFTKV
jgi:hypothetical protein